MASCRLWLRGFPVAGMFLWGLLVVSLILPALHGLGERRARRWRERIVLNWNRTVCRLLNLRIRVSGHRDPAARLTVANHVSWLDIIALGSLQPLVFVAKAEVADWPVMGRLARGIGTVFIRRGDAEQSAATLEAMTWMLRRGAHLMLFPEGTTTPGDQVLRFHGKLFNPAQLTAVKVQSVALHYRGASREVAPFVDDDDFLPHLLRILRQPAIELDLHYCPALPAGLRRDQLAKAARLQICEWLEPTLSHPSASRRSFTKL